MQLRPYQDKAVTYAVENLFQEKNSLIVAGTGAGKTIMLSEAIKRFTVAFKGYFGRFPHTLVLVHRTEIHNQNLSKFHLVAPSIQTSEIVAERKSVHGLVHFGMVQTVINLIDDLPQFDLIVVDEAHHTMASTYLSIINKNKQKGPNETFLLGVSATPNRGDKLPLIDLFNNFYQITTQYLIDSHFLVRPKFIDLSPKFDNEFGYLQKNVDWKSAESVKIIDNLVDDYLRHKEDGKSIIFAPNHEICSIIVSSLIAKGRKPSYLANGISPEQRISEIERFENGDAEELINVDIATEGYDYPELRNVVEFDTNGNETQWIQKVGRGLRIAPGKQGCTVIDFGGNLHKYPNVEVSVNLEGEYKAEKGKRLTSGDFFRTTSSRKSKVEFQDKIEYSPYSLPDGWETVNDEGLGIVYVLCGSKSDSLIVKNNDRFYLFMTDKSKLTKYHIFSSFDDCIKAGDDYVKSDSESVWLTVKPISRMQIKQLAPKYPTMTLNYHSANCFICFECWRSVITGMLTILAERLND